MTGSRVGGGGVGVRRRGAVRVAAVLVALAVAGSWKAPATRAEGPAMPTTRPATGTARLVGETPADSATTRPATEGSATRTVGPATVATRPAAPTLAERVPAGAVFYASWAGRQNLPADFPDSHFAYLLNAVDLDAWARDTLPRLFPASDNSGVRTQVVELFRTIAEYAWDNPSAMYSTGPGVSEQLVPGRQVCLMIRFADARAADEAMAAIRMRLSAIAGGDPIPDVRFHREGTVLALTANDPSERSPLAPVLTPLGDDARFRECLEQAGPGAVTVYVDLEKVWSRLDEDNEADAGYARNMKIAGLRQARAVMLSGDFDGRDYRASTFVKLERDPAAGGAVGYLASTRPVDDRLYAAVPRSALSMNSFSLDLQDLLTRVRTEGEQFKPGFTKQADAWIGLAGGLLNVNIPELAAAAGPEVAIYTLPGGRGSVYDFVLVSRPRDPAKLDQQLLGLAQGIQRILLTQRPDIVPFTVTHGPLGGRPANGGAGGGGGGEGLVVTTLSNGSVSPSWTIRDGYLVMAPSLRSLVNAVGEMSRGSLNDAEGFAALRARLGAPAGASLSYTDLPRTLVNMYANWQFTMRWAGDRVPLLVRELPVPTGAQLEPETTPAASATWTDETGLHHRSIAPYAGAELLSPVFSVLVGPGALTVRGEELRDRVLTPKPPATGAPTSRP